MRIDKLLNAAKPSVSIEVFPPKKAANINKAKLIVAEMAKLQPSFISVTYGAAGTTSGFTTEIAAEIKSDGIPALSHLTCLTSTKEKIDSVLTELKENGIENILALRGDIPGDYTIKEKIHFFHADALIKEIKNFSDFCVGAACYPEIHPESGSREDDLRYLKGKQDAGADFFTTQMFFDNRKFYDFKNICAKTGITIPLVAGIMPITSIKQIGRSVSLSGSSLPKKFTGMAAKYGDEPEAMREAGIDYAVNQIRDLLKNGQKNIHIYSMNKPDITAKILAEINDLL